MKRKYFKLTGYQNKKSLSMLRLYVIKAKPK